MTDLYEQALKRGLDFHTKTPEEKWAIDKALGILDWDGNCSHQNSGMCPACRKRYDEHVLPFKARTTVQREMTTEEKIAWDKRTKKR